MHLFFIEGDLKIMSAMKPLSCLIGINSAVLSKKENFILEAGLFVRICEELIEVFREQRKDYFRLMKFTIEKENSMLEGKFAQWLINDILSTNEYTIIGIAYYTDSYEDVILEIIAGLNENPSAIFLRKLINLHMSVRKDLYNVIIKKIVSQYLAAA